VREVRRRGNVVVTLRLRRDRRAALRGAGKLDGQATLLFTTLDGAEYERRLAVRFLPETTKRKRRKVKRS
jgi:hypothetical protein